MPSTPSLSHLAGVVAIIAKGLVSFYGIGHLFYAVILMGIFQLAIFVLRGGQFVHLIPHTVMQGAFNGLSLVIAFAQVRTGVDQRGFVQRPTTSGLFTL